MNGENLGEGEYDYYRFSISGKIFHFPFHDSLRFEAQDTTLRASTSHQHGNRIYVFMTR